MYTIYLDFQESLGTNLRPREFYTHTHRSPERKDIQILLGISSIFKTHPYNHHRVHTDVKSKFKLVYMCHKAWQKRSH